MSQPHRIIIWSLVCLCGLALWSPARAVADPTPACRDLAARFASAPAELDVHALAALMSCVSAEVQVRAGATEPPPPPNPSEAAPPPPPPPPPPPTPPPAGGWGGSLSSAPWGGSWPPAAPWDR